MYVDPFVAGAVSVLLGQFIGCIIYVTVKVIKARKDEKNGNKQDKV